MWPKCSQCNTRIVAGGEKFLKRKFCGKNCVRAFKISMIDQFVPPEVLAERVREAFEGPCPLCRETTKNDVFHSTKLTALVVVEFFRTERVLCCAMCGRKKRFGAALHCMVAGWWGYKAIFCNLFVLPTNVIGGLLIRTPKQPTPKLVEHVKVTLAEQIDAWHSEPAAS